MGCGAPGRGTAFVEGFLSLCLKAHVTVRRDELKQQHMGAVTYACCGFRLRSNQTRHSEDNWACCTRCNPYCRRNCVPWRRCLQHPRQRGRYRSMCAIFVRGSLLMPQRSALTRLGSESEVEAPQLTKQKIRLTGCCIHCNFYEQAAHGAARTGEYPAFRGEVFCGVSCDT